jgi:hypothetical protein
VRKREKVSFQAIKGSAKSGHQKDVETCPIEIPVYQNHGRRASSIKILLIPKICKFRGGMDRLIVTNIKNSPIQFSGRSINKGRSESKHKHPKQLSKTTYS